MTKGDYEILAAFRYELRRFLSFSEQAAAGQDLAPQQYLALLAIKGFPGREHITVGQLAEQLQITPHSAVGLLNRLQERGLVTRALSHEDRRVVFISLTPEGDRILERLASAHRIELRRVGPLLVKLLSQVTTATNPEVDA